MKVRSYSFNTVNEAISIIKNIFPKTERGIEAIIKIVHKHLIMI